MASAGIIFGLIATIAAIYFGSRIFVVDHSAPSIKSGYFGAGSKHEDSPSINPMTIGIPDDKLATLKSRIEAATFVDPLEDSQFNYGFNSKYLRSVQSYWLHKYDWSKYEALLNSFSHFNTEIEGLKVHFIRAKPAKKYKKIIPLLLIHGWPGSVFEFYKIIPMLIEPAGDEFAFEVIAPSIPGYGWSEASKKKGFGGVSCARIFNKLMKKLKFDKYVVQGGDWGAVIASFLAVQSPENLIGLHTNMASVSPSDFPSLMPRFILSAFVPSLVLEPNDVPKLVPFSDRFSLLLQESGYFHIQATKPDTPGIALNDSPMGLAAYILEKFSTWTNPLYRSLEDGGLTRHFTLDELLTNIMIYWSTNSITSSMRFYKEHFKDPEMAQYEAAYIDVPSGIAVFPNELLRFPHSFLSVKYRNITSYTDMLRGGHFGCFEEPKLMAIDIFQFVLPLVI